MRDDLSLKTVFLLLDLKKCAEFLYSSFFVTEDEVKWFPLPFFAGRCVLYGATRGVTVSMSAFLACHQCYCAGSSLAWGLNLRAVVCGIF